MRTWAAPPNWPQPPPGWSPHPGWHPDPRWGPPPAGWQWWQEVGEPHRPRGRRRPRPPYADRLVRSRGAWGIAAVRRVEVVLAVMAGLAILVSVTVVGTNSDPTARPPADASVADEPTVTPPLSAEVPATAAAAAALASLAVKGRSARTGYSREAFGQRWADVDRNGCDTRNDVLRRDLRTLALLSSTRGCKVAAGTLADPYTGWTITYFLDRADEVQIDHVVSLSNAWQTGAAAWTVEKRTALANDPLDLLAVDGPANQAKSDGDAATWLPPNKGFRCQLVARQVSVKAKYGLWVTAAERDAVTRVLAACPDEPALSGQNPEVVTPPLGRDAPIRLPPRPTPSRAATAPADPSPTAAAPPQRLSPPTSEPGAGARGAVRPGAFCSPEGATGTGTSNGKPYTCTRKPGEERARWRQ